MDVYQELETIKKANWKTILIDPPWPIEWRPSKFTGKVGLPYRTMLISDICALPIKSLCHPAGAKILLWTTNEFLPEALSMVTKVWGLHYVKLITYIKPQKLGWPPYNSTEYCVLAYNGRPSNKRGSSSVSNWYKDDVKRKHSVKPDALYDSFESFTSEPRLEMFARKRRDGWTQLGDQLK